jgi:hypothetical protein
MPQQVSHLLKALGAAVCTTMVWRDAQEARGSSQSEATGSKVASYGRRRDDVRGQGQGSSGWLCSRRKERQDSGIEVLVEGDGGAFRQWLESYVEELGVGVLISDDNDSYS